MKYKNNKPVRELNGPVFGEIVFETSESFRIHSSSTVFEKKRFWYKRFISLIFFFSTLIGYSQEVVSEKVEKLLDDCVSLEEIMVVLPYLNNTSYIPSIFPITGTNDFRITSVFGARFHPIEKKNKKHLGVDVAAKIGTLVVATADGEIDKVVFSDYGYGRNIVVKHKYGFETKYCHLAIILVQDKQFVKKGDVIGMVGSTGKSTGNHLHYEVLKNKKQLDPSSFLLLDFKEEN